MALIDVIWSSQSVFGVSGILLILASLVLSSIFTDRLFLMEHR